MKSIIPAILCFAIIFGSGCSRTVEEKTVEQETGLVNVGRNQADSRRTTTSGTTHDHLADAQLSQPQKKEYKISTSKPAAHESLAVTPATRTAASPISIDREGSVLPPQQGRMNRESYDNINENIFKNTRYNPLSTFSIDVDTASYANVRRLLTGNRLPPVGAVRIEEMINYFHYDYQQPQNGLFTLDAEVGPSPWNEEYSLVRIGLQGKNVEKQSLPPSNLVFLIDVSGSMHGPGKLPLLKKAMKLLVDQLNEQDRLAIVVYAGSDRIVLRPTAGSEKQTIYNAIDSLTSGGSTHGSKGILTAYELAERTKMPSGNNRVILASDGDFNVGITSRGELQKLVEEKRKSGIYLSVFGFGTGNYHDDTMELLADKGNGNYAYIDSLLEAKKVMVRQMSGTLFALARDVKIQIEFNPQHIGAYRLIGYENRLLEDEDFVDDSKDAGEVGVGHQVTALYEIIPAGHDDIPKIDTLKYQKPQIAGSDAERELMTIKLRYKPGKSSKSKLLERSVSAEKTELAATSDDFRFAAAVAGFGMHLRSSDQLRETTLADITELARQARGKDDHGYRAECIRLMELAQLLTK